MFRMQIVVSFDLKYSSISVELSASRAQVWSEPQQFTDFDARLEYYDAIEEESKDCKRFGIKCIGNRTNVLHGRQVEKGSSMRFLIRLLAIAFFCMTALGILVAIKNIEMYKGEPSGKVSYAVGSFAVPFVFLILGIAAWNKGGEKKNHEDDDFDDFDDEEVTVRVE